MDKFLKILKKRKERKKNVKVKESLKTKLVTRFSFIKTQPGDGGQLSRR